MFRKWLESSSKLDALVSLLIEKNPGLKLYAYESKEKIELMEIEVPVGLRGGRWHGGDQGYSELCSFGRKANCFEA